ncbi:MAG: hypothetical protein ACE5HE_10535 [Phycisphaerae bacterium]
MLRNSLEHRGELTAMQVVGFSRRAFPHIVLIENGALLFGGLAAGTAPALVARMPYVVASWREVPAPLTDRTVARALTVGMPVVFTDVVSALRRPLSSPLCTEQSLVSKKGDVE